jgi:hypothetical protein
MLKIYWKELTPKAIFFRMSIRRFRRMENGRMRQMMSVVISISDKVNKNAVRVY